MNDSLPERGQDAIESSSAKAHCPSCGATSGFAPAVELRGSFSWFVFLAGGIFAVLFRNAGRRKKVKCNNCGTLFEIRSTLSTVSLVFFWLLICPTVITLIILLLNFLYTVFLS
jgi:hypothetical protein